MVLKEGKKRIKSEADIIICMTYDPKGRRGRVAEATIGIKLPDPTVEGLYVPPAADTDKERLTIANLRASLQSCNVTLDRVKFSLEKFIQDLRGVFAIKIRGQPFVIYMTENPEKGEKRFYVRYPKTHETMHDLIPGLMDTVDLKNNFHLQTPDGKTQFYSWVTKKHYMNLLSIADKPPAVKTDEETIAITESRFDSRDELKRKLAKLRDVPSDYLFFDFAEFVQSISFVSPMRTDSPHYYIETGDGDSSFLLFVNSAEVPSERRAVITKFKYNNDSCVLYLEA
jgi:hypothetical protein